MHVLSPIYPVIITLQVWYTVVVNRAGRSKVLIEVDISRG